MRMGVCGGAGVKVKLISISERSNLSFNAQWRKTVHVEIKRIDCAAALNNVGVENAGRFRVCLRITATRGGNHPFVGSPTLH